MGNTVEYPASGDVLQRRAVITRVEQDDLHPPAGRPEDLGRVNPLLFSAFTVRRLVEKIHQRRLRPGPVRVLGPAVVEPVVVVVPGHHDG